MTRAPYIAAPPGELYWRRERCPHNGSKVLLLTVGGVAVIGQWYGELGEAFVAWCPLPTRGEPPADIMQAGLRSRLRYAFKLIFQPALRRNKGAL